MGKTNAGGPAGRRHARLPNNSLPRLCLRRLERRAGGGGGRMAQVLIQIVAADQGAGRLEDLAAGGRLLPPRRSSGC